MNHDYPDTYRRFMERYRSVWEAYDRVGAEVHGAGPLDERTRSLIKLALAAAAGQEGAVHSHTRKALSAGASVEEIRQVILLMLPTLGFPPMMAALSWVEDVLSPEA